MTKDPSFTIQPLTDPKLKAIIVELIAVLNRQDHLLTALCKKNGMDQHIIDAIKEHADIVLERMNLEHKYNK